jgi:hypothetical protein
MTCTKSDHPADGEAEEANRLRGLRQEMADLDFTADDLAPGASRYTSADGTVVVSIGHDNDRDAVVIARLSPTGPEAWTLTLNAHCPPVMQIVALYTALHADSEHTVTDLVWSIADAFNLDPRPVDAAATANLT